MKNFAPSATATLDPDVMAEAIGSGFIPLHVVCSEDSESEDGSGDVDLWTFVSIVPRIGERLELEDGSVLEVKRVHWKHSRRGAITSLLPYLIAVRIGGSD